MHYTEGEVAYDADGSKLGHGVLPVGFDTGNCQEYILVKNSWGTSWGVDGYIKLAAKDGKNYIILSKSKRVSW